MAGGINKAILIGNLGRDPEVRYVSSGNPVANFTLATSESFKDKSGTKQTRTVWHNIVVWGKLAEICKQYLKKGSQIYVEGRIDNRSYDDKDGNKRYVSEVVLDFNGKMLMLGSRNSGSGAGDDFAQPEPGDDSQVSGGPLGPSMPPSGKGGTDDSDLPF
ncbi:MAG: single-stranded DNA-binding protein [Fibrobacterota bacterium]